MNEFIVAVTIIGLVIFFIAQRPSTFTWTRRLVMPHPADKIFPHVNNLKKWNDWSPWAKMDPNCKTTFEGPEEGNGAVMKWEGNRDVGMGSITVTSSQPAKKVGYRLDFLKPMKGTSTAEMTFTPDGAGTAVDWTMTGKNNFVAKLMGIFIDCEKMIGEQFEKGLANLNDVVKKAG
jgi:hypothetical protein